MLELEIMYIFVYSFIGFRIPVKWYSGELSDHELFLMYIYKYIRDALLNLR